MTTPPISAGTDVKKGFPLGQEMMQKATEGRNKRGDVLVAAPRF
jgi:hypothetical protein